MILALEYQRSPGRYLVARGVTSSAVGNRLAGMVAGNVAPLRLLNRPEPDVPGQGWTRLSPRLSGV